MAFIELHTKKLKHNFDFLNKLFSASNIQWGIVTKLLCGNPDFIKEVSRLGCQQMMDSRVSNLQTIKKINPEIETIYIKPPAKRALKSIVKYADISFNTELATIKLLSEEAGKQNKVHKVIIMIEMGDLREGVMGDDLMDFYGKIFNLPNIKVVGIGANLNCLNGIMPSEDKLIQLSLYSQLIQTRFNKNIPLVSGGSSVTVPLIFKHLVPKGVNHFRIGETLFFGKDLFSDKLVPGMQRDVFMVFAEIIELNEKPLVPSGEIGTNVAGEVKVFDEEDYGKTTYRAILDIGLLDIDIKNLEPVDKGVAFQGASSDMIVLDLGVRKPKYKVGDLVAFRVNYMGTLSILNSDYISKKVV